MPMIQVTSTDRLLSAEERTIQVNMCAFRVDAKEIVTFVVVEMKHKSKY